jgi:ubiquitin C-terminal hydrolase
MVFFQDRTYGPDENETSKCRRGDTYYPAARRLRVQTEIETRSTGRIIQLARYVYHRDTPESIATAHYIDAAVDMPDRLEDLRLQAIIRHYGRSPRSGHYVALVRENGEWYRANDAVVERASAEVVQDAMRAGYLYYYGV